MTQIVAAIFVRDGNILLGKRAPYKTYPNCWDLIGGHLENDETPKQALIRESIEEVGLTPQRVVALAKIGEPGGSVCHVFAVYDWSGGEPAMLGDEHVDLGWFPIDQACAIETLALADYREVFRTLSPTA
jgi:8-oxo-dGTP pyrophosphatase MutT (NUDIX family)